MTCFTQEYHKRYERSPPSFLKQWLRFAESNGCDIMRYYNAIEHDLVLFRKRRKVGFQFDYDKVADEASQYSDYNVVIHVQHNKLTFVHWKIPFKMTLWKQLERLYLKYAILWLFRPLINHKPAINTTFVMNLRHESTR